MMNSKSVAYGIAGLAVVASIGYSVYNQEQIKKSIDKLTGKVHVDIDDPYVCEAVDRAIDREVYKKINSAAKKAIDTVSRDMSTKIDKEVKSAYSDVKKEVKTELKRQVGEVDIEGVRQEVIDEAKIAAVEKLKGDMDVILKGYNNDLENIRKIYANIAKTIEGSTERRGTTLTIG